MGLILAGTKSDPASRRSADTGNRHSARRRLGDAVDTSAVRAPERAKVTAARPVESALESIDPRALLATTNEITLRLEGAASRETARAHHRGSSIAARWEYGSA